ncbi:MAG TPA: hypothetical protein VK518_07545 [Puia sp.]|nr:hypothetical protein [Puia sp.]
MTISTFNGQNGVKIWLKANSLVQDSPYTLDGKTGNIQLYDRNGNVVGSSSMMQLSFYKDSSGKVFGNVAGMMGNMVQMPAYAPASANFYNVYLPIEFKK